MIIDVISLQVLGADAFFDSGGGAIDTDDEKVDILGWKLNWKKKNRKVG